MDDDPKVVHNYFVDEAGDLTLFNKHGKVMLGRDGVSSFFMIGLAQIITPLEEVEAKVAELRQNLLRDPYFAGVPSMRQDIAEKKKKTAKVFHATDDLPEVRWEVFKLLSTFEVKVKVVIRRKAALIREARLLFDNNRSKLKPKDIYYPAIQLLFKDTLSEASRSEIIFDRLDKVTHKKALKEIIMQAHQNFVRKKGGRDTQPPTVETAPSYEFAGLQVIDY